MNKTFEGASVYSFEDFAQAEVDALNARIQKQPGFAQLRQRIWQEGFEAGQKETKQDLASERRELIQGPILQVQAILEGLAAKREEFMTGHMEEIIQLACSVARRVTRVEVTHNTDVIMEKLKICLMQLDRESSYLIKINPSQVDALETLLKEHGRNLLQDLPYRILGDRRVPVGGLVLEGDHARLESICEAELDRLEAHLMDLNRQPEGT